jgi:hypothetical protein
LPVSGFSRVDHLLSHVAGDQRQLTVLGSAFAPTIESPWDIAAIDEDVRSGGKYLCITRFQYPFRSMDSGKRPESVIRVRSGLEVERTLSCACTRSDGAEMVAFLADPVRNAQNGDPGLSARSIQLHSVEFDNGGNFPVIISSSSMLYLCDLVCLDGGNIGLGIAYSGAVYLNGYLVPFKGRDENGQLPGYAVLRMSREMSVLGATSIEAGFWKYPHNMVLTVRPIGLAETLVLYENSPGEVWLGRIDQGGQVVWNRPVMKGNVRGFELVVGEHGSIVIVGLVGAGTELSGGRGEWEGLDDIDQSSNSLLVVRFNESGGVTGFEVVGPLGLGTSDGSMSIARLESGVVIVASTAAGDLVVSDGQGGIESRFNMPQRRYAFAFLVGTDGVLEAGLDVIALGAITLRDMIGVGPNRAVVLGEYHGKVTFPNGESFGGGWLNQSGLDGETRSFVAVLGLSRN